jgi:hypothetical protein
MNDRVPDMLENPAGTAYPTSVQNYLRTYGVADAGQLEDLVHALEAAIAADREHRPQPPELDQHRIDVLVSIFLSGFTSGGATMLAQAGSGDVAQHIATMMTYRILEDPATRLQLEDITQRIWRGEAEHLAWQSFDAYRHDPRNHRND